MSILTREPYTADVYEAYLALSQFSETDQDVVCHHPGVSRFPYSDDDVCYECYLQSSKFWYPFLLQWKTSLGATLFGLQHPGTHLNVDKVLEYASAINDLHEKGFTPMLGVYPREEVVERLLGMDAGAFQTLRDYCPRKQCPVAVQEYDSAEPPFINQRLRRFMSSSAPLLPIRSVDVVHRDLAKQLITTFLRPTVDAYNVNGKEVKAYAELMWIQHVICVEAAFDNSRLWEFFRTVDIYHWFEWAFEEGWNQGLSEDRRLRIDPVELVSKFVDIFLNVSEATRVENIIYLDVQLKRFLNKHFVSYHNQCADITLPNRFISSSFHLNFPHGIQIQPNDTHPIPPHLRLNRHLLTGLLSFNSIEKHWRDELEDVEEAGKAKEEDVSVDVYVPRWTRKRLARAEETNMNVLVLASDDMVVDSAPPVLPASPHIPSQSEPAARLPDATEMDRVFECLGFFEIWDRGDRCCDVWRSMKDTHEDLAVCCLQVLIECEMRNERKMDDQVLLYARHAWSYHLSFSNPSLKLFRLLEVATVAFAARSIELDSAYCHHPSRVVEWLNGITYEDFNAPRLLAKWEPLLHASPMDGVVPCTPAVSFQEILTRPCTPAATESALTSYDYSTNPAGTRPRSLSTYSSLSSLSTLPDSSTIGPASYCDSIASHGTTRPPSPTGSTGTIGRSTRKGSVAAGSEAESVNGGKDRAGKKERASPYASAKGRGWNLKAKGKGKEKERDQGSSLGKLDEED